MKKINWLFLILIILAFLTRFLFLDYPAEVVFDEVHFGKFVSSYFTHQYYFDIHPPLGKLMIAGFARVFGFQGNFEFAHIGEVFDAYNLFILRFLPAFFGALFVLLIYQFILVLGLSKKAAFLGSFLVLFDNAILTQSKFILVDIFLLFFGFASLYFFFLSRQQYENPEAVPPKAGRYGAGSSRAIVFSLLAGIFAGLSLSIKWTGLSFLGIIIFFIFLDFLGNLKTKEFLQKLIIFTFFPFLIYLSIFAIHFNLLKNSGPGNAFMTPSFQKTLLENKVTEDVKPLSFWGKFSELNIAMYKYNASIKALHPDSSKWYKWPLMKKPIWYWTRQNLLPQNLGGQAQNQVANIYFLGNPLIWWLTSFSVALSIFLMFLKKFRKKLSALIYFLLFGYFINLLPFIFIGRVTFLYHYLPSLAFGIMIFTTIYDKLFAGKTHFFLYFGFLIIIFLTFLFFAPFTYGLAITSEKYQIYNQFLQFIK